MLSYHDLKSNSRVLRAFTSLDPAEFEILLIPFEKAWQNYINRYYIHKKSRKRRYGGGRKPHLLAIEDKLLFIRDLSRERESSEQFGWLNRRYGETETQLGRSAITPSIRADSSQNEMI